MTTTTMAKTRIDSFLFRPKIADKSYQQIIVDISKLLVKMSICARVLSKLAVLKDSIWRLYMIGEQTNFFRPDVRNKKIRVPAR